MLYSTLFTTFAALASTTMVAAAPARLAARDVTVLGATPMPVCPIKIDTTKLPYVQGEERQELIAAFVIACYGGNVEDPGASGKVEWRSLVSIDAPENHLFRDHNSDNGVERLIGWEMTYKGKIAERKVTVATGSYPSPLVYPNDLKAACVTQLTQVINQCDGATGGIYTEDSAFYVKTVKQ